MARGKKKRKNTDEVSRTMRLHKVDGTHVDLYLEKATAIRSSEIQILHLDSLPSGYRLTISDGILDDMKNFKSLEMIRDEDDE